MKFSEMEKCKLYKVIRSSSDMTILVGDIICLDKQGRLWKDKSLDGSQAAWLDPDDFIEETLDFEVKDLSKLDKKLRS